MTSIDDDQKPTLGERYMRATTSTHLRLQEGRCDVDLLIAAGWLKQDALGTLLYRLRGEFDAVRASLRAADANRPEWDRLIKAAEKAAKEGGSPLPSAVRNEPERLRREAQLALLAERFAVLSRLKTLAVARDGLGTFGVSLATKICFMQDDAMVGLLVGRALDAWLDPLCDSCQGRKFNGGSHRGDPVMTCRACRGSGLRRDALGRDSEERRFIQALLASVDRMLVDVEQRMRAFLDHQTAQAQQHIGTDSVEQMQHRLDELRSADAQRD